MALLQELQVAIEGQNNEQFEKISSQIQELNSSWNGLGEATMRLNAERAKVKKSVGDNLTPELKAALDAYNTASDRILKVLEEKQALEKEFREVTVKQREALESLHKEIMSAKHKDKPAVK